MNKYIPYDDDKDPAMRYEGLARYAFDCESYGGPNNIAHQSVYNFYFVPELKKEGINILTMIIDALITKSSYEKKHEFEEIKSSLPDRMKQNSAINLIDYLIKIIKS
jgi:hypothetical protein